MRRGICIAVLALAASLWLTPADAQADGVIMRATALPAGQHAALARGIERARHAHPEAFARIRTLEGHRPAAYRKTRGQEPSVLGELRALGPGATWALLDAVAGNGLDRGTSTEREWSALREGLLLALAERRAPQAASVFEFLFASSDGEDTLRGAAIGLGMLGGERQRSMLIHALGSSGPRRAAALWGLRHVRDPKAAGSVAALLGRTTDDETARLAVRALGYMGSSWAWKTGRAGDAGHEEPVRRLCSDALLSAFERHDGRVREQAARSLSMVRHPSMLPRIEERIAQLGDTENRRAWIALRRRLVRSANAAR